MNKIICYKAGFPFAILFGIIFGFIPALLSTNNAVIMAPMISVALIFSGTNLVSMEIKERLDISDTRLQTMAFFISMVISMVLFCMILYMY